MEQKIENNASVDVFNSRHDGYRRAGLTLTHGKNEFTELTTDQISMLQADLALTVTINKVEKEEDENPNPDDGGDLNPAGNPPKTNSDETDGENENKGNPDTTGDQSNSKTPAATQPPIELSQAVMVALAESDESVYFNKDGSPKIAKWREVTGNAELTKDDIAAAIAAAQNEE